MEEATIRRPGVTLRFFDGCPNWQTTLTRLKEVLTELGDGKSEVTLERVETSEDAERLRFVGSPTILLNGRDPLRNRVANTGLHAASTGRPKDQQVLQRRSSCARH